MFHPIIAGVDPGIVHTGLVILEFDPENRVLSVEHAAIDGLDAQATYETLRDSVYPRDFQTVDVFIEKYRPRSGFSVDQDMVTANATFKAALHGKLVMNSGVKKIVSKELMELFGVWKFSTPTHHADLRSAARIALLGMLLDKKLNKLVYDFVVDDIEGKEWHVEVR